MINNGKQSLLRLHLENLELTWIIIFRKEE
jgi:hypothetical protein